MNMFKRLCVCMYLLLRSLFICMCMLLVSLILETINKREAVAEF